MFEVALFRFAEIGSSIAPVTGNEVNLVSLNPAAVQDYVEGDRTRPEKWTAAEITAQGEQCYRIKSSIPNSVTVHA